MEHHTQYLDARRKRKLRDGSRIESDLADNNVETFRNGSRIESDLADNNVENWNNIDMSNIEREMLGSY